jgi:pSer/pThr/pTyr-binding forkhead associated (FHA) protein
MNCTTCGRENPPHLTFCQECGQRLGPRIAPPTPPIGLPGQELPPRVPTQGAGMPATPAPPPAHGGPPPPTTTERRCAVCDTLNVAGLRYCTSCGSALEAAPPGPPPAMAVPAPAPPTPLAAAPAHAAAPPPAPAAAPAPPMPRPVMAAAAPVPVPMAGPAPIAPVRVVDLGATTPASVDFGRTCPRCRGQVDPGAQFCKFCGASLASEPSPPPQEAPAAAPPPPPLPERRPVTSPLAQGPSAPPLAPAPAVAASAPPAVPSRGRTHGRLVVIAKSGADGPSYPIGDTLDIGRQDGHVVVGEDPYLSPRHVRIIAQGGKLLLRDLASTNGVYLRLAPARDMKGRKDGGSDAEVAVPLEDQDLILVGQQVLRFEIVRDGEAGLGPAAEHGTLLFGSPAGPRYARLGQRTVEGITRDVYYVRKMETVFGRESGDVVFTEDPFLSRRHAAIRLVGRDGDPLPAGTKVAPGDARFALVDLGSSNGTFLRIRTEIALVRGDHFRVGQQLFRVDLDGGQAA